MSQLIVALGVTVNVSVRQPERMQASLEGSSGWRSSSSGYCHSNELETVPCLAQVAAFGHGQRKLSLKRPIKVEVKLSGDWLAFGAGPKCSVEEQQLSSFPGLRQTRKPDVTPW